MANGFKEEGDKDKFEIDQIIFLIDACRSPLPKVDSEETSSTNQKNLNKENKSVEANDKLTQKSAVLTTEDSETKTSSAKSNKDIISSKSISFQNYGEGIPEIVNDAKGVVILIGTSPNEASLEDEDLQSGKFTYYIIKVISGGIQDETPAEYVTLQSLELYVKKKFDLEQEEYLKFANENNETLKSKPTGRIRKWNFALQISV